jgi:hypothetical protein
MHMAGVDDATVMELVGHLTKKMLDRYTHPPIERKRAALESFDQVVAPPLSTFSVPPKRHIASTRAARNSVTDPDPANLLREIGGRQEARTPDLRVANTFEATA